MNQPKQGSLGIAVAVCAIVVLVITSIGYYQYVYYPNNVATTTTTTTFTGKAVTINITAGASTKTTDAYLPYQVTLVVGVNNTVIFYNNDSASGGIPHTATDHGGAFDTGVLAYGQASSPITITKPGTYNYYCQIHPTTMRGIIVVVEGTGAPSTGGTTTSAAASTSTAPSKSSTTAAGPRVSILKGAATDQTSPGYAPATLTVIVGVNSTVTWTNDDASPHTVTAVSVPSGAKSFDSGNMNNGDAFSYTFTVPGTYQYHCTYHPWMKATVIVKSS